MGATSITATLARLGITPEVLEKAQALQVREDAAAAKRAVGDHVRDALGTDALNSAVDLLRPQFKKSGTSDWVGASCVIDLGGISVKFQVTDKVATQANKDGSPADAVVAEAAAAALAATA